MSDQTHPGEVMEFARQWRKSQRQDEDTAKSVGLILDAPKPRDAIHVAVVCAQASGKVYPGEATGIVDGIATTEEPPVGIVDPFLFKPVQQGQHFWIFLYPGTITSLNHSWTHPGIPPEGHPEPQEGVSPLPRGNTADSKEEAEKWLTAFAEACDLSFQDLLYMAGAKQLDEDYFYLFSEDDHPHIEDEFWEAYEAYTDTEAKVKENFFSCSC